jgi:hypothetical protein
MRAHEAPPGRWSPDSFRLYRLRMLCGPIAHSAPFPLDVSHLQCAMNNLLHSYYVSLIHTER